MLLFSDSDSDRSKAGQEVGGTGNHDPMVTLRFLIMVMLRVCFPFEIQKTEMLLTS